MLLSAGPGQPPNCSNVRPEARRTLAGARNECVSDMNPTPLSLRDGLLALAVMAVCFIVNVVVFVVRLFCPPWSYNVYLLAAAWLAIALTIPVVILEPAG